MYQSFIKALLADVKKLFLETLFPITCFSCNKEGVFLCAACQPKLKSAHQVCIACKKPSLAGLTHPKCLSPLMADQFISFFDYRDNLVSKLIIRGKYYFIPDIFKLFAEMLVPKLQTEFPLLVNKNTALVPIPLHKWRQRWRGFNQAQILCQTLGGKLEMGTENLLERRRFTRTQKDLKKEERQKNTANAFRLSPNARLALTQVILVDDVATTGATLLEAVKVLKRNGAEKVTCLTIARD